jgi:hypothetical protein
MLNAAVDRDDGKPVLRPRPAKRFVAGLAKWESSLE